MMKTRVLGLLALLLSVAIPAVADEAQLVTPQLTKPATEAAEGDALHEKYEAAWFRYEKAISEVRGKVNTALDARFEKAADAGNLDLADMWDKKKKMFLDTGSVTWPSDGKAKVEWRKTYPTTEFPDDFSEVIAAAGAGFEKAVATLKEDYESLVKDYTKGRNLPRAKELRDELAGLARKPVAPAEPTATAEKKTGSVQPKTEAIKPILERLVGRWGHPNDGLVRVIGADGSCSEIRKNDGGIHSRGTVIVRSNGPSVIKLANGFTLEIELIGPDDNRLAYRAISAQGKPEGPGKILQRMP